VNEITNRKRRVGAEKRDHGFEINIIGAEKLVERASTVGVTSRSDIKPEIGRVSAWKRQQERKQNNLEGANRRVEVRDVLYKHDEITAIL